MPEISALSSEASITAAPGLIPGVALGSDLILLRAAFGQDEANHDTVRYAVDADGLVRVPREAAYPLISKGGFALQGACGDVVSTGMLRLHHENAAGCSYLGQRYIGDKNGDVLVPAEAASELIGHGFVAVLPGTTLVSRRTKSLPTNRSTKV
jgi:hypothetical protein